jgi:putative spermidine/putrescine transport system substrate-binding protein
MSKNRSDRQPSRRDVLCGGAALAAAPFIVGGGLLQAREAFAATMDDWTLPPDIEKAKIEGLDYQSYGMPDTWANYGEVLQELGKTLGITIHHTDTDMSSLEEITKFDAEKGNPVAITSDIGIMFGPLAEAKDVVPPYMPPNAANIPAHLKGIHGGWVPTFAGVPAIAVNTDIINNVPQTWDDLLKPEYKGKIGSVDPSSGGATQVAQFLAWVYAHGGDQDNLTPGIEYAKKLIGQFTAAEGNSQTFEKGEVPIQLKHDFNLIAMVRDVQAKGTNAEVIIPGVSIYMPSAIMANKYNLAKMNIAKLMLDFVLSDTGQIAFAKFGARPMRAVLGDLTLPDEAKANWLPDSMYANVKNDVDWSRVNLQQIAEIWQDHVVGG